MRIGRIREVEIRTAPNPAQEKPTIGRRGPFRSRGVCPKSCCRRLATCRLLPDQCATPRPEYRSHVPADWPTDGVLDWGVCGDAAGLPGGVVVVRDGYRLPRSFYRIRAYSAPAVRCFWKCLAFIHFAAAMVSIAFAALSFLYGQMWRNTLRRHGESTPCPVRRV